MSGISRQDVWQKLREQSLVDGELPESRTAHSPWFVRAMLGVAGWIGAMFLLGFVGAAYAFVMNNAFASLVLGGLCCGGAYAMFVALPERDFAAQFGLAVSLAGQVLIATGVFKAFASDSAMAYAILGLIEALLAVLMPNFIHRFISSWAALVAMSFVFWKIGVHGVAPAVTAVGFAAIWLNEMRWAGRDAVWRPIGYGAAFALLQIDATPLFGHSLWMQVSADASWLAVHAAAVSTTLVGVVLVVATWRLLASQGVSSSSGAGIAAIVAALLVTTVSYQAPGIATALLVLLVGFGAGNRILVGIGLLALGGFLSHYYYQLQTTLLHKSAILAASGAALLIARMAMQKWFGDAAGENAHG
jgi:uncharacterized membrane protein